MQITIKQLIEYFNSIEISNKPIKLNECETIYNQKLFIETHINYLKVNSGNSCYYPYYKRLIKFKNILENGSH